MPEPTQHNPDGQEDDQGFTFVELNNDNGPISGAPDALVLPDTFDNRDRLIDRMATVGAEFPPDFRPRIIIADNTELAAENLSGSPISVIRRESGLDRPIVISHEITHSFVVTHLFPNQPQAGINWDLITDEEAVAACYNDLHYGSESTPTDELVASLNDSAKAKLGLYGGLSPVDAVQHFAEDLPNKRSLNESAVQYAIEEEEDQDFQTLHFEAINAVANKILMNKLRRYVYGPYGVHQGMNFEEGVATYFAHFAVKGGVSSDGEDFNQGERAKEFTLKLSERYPDSRQLAAAITTRGMMGVMSDNRDMFRSVEA